MPLNPGTKPPIHRRWTEAEALEQIRNRYRHCRDKISVQIHSLQQDERFCAQARDLYHQEYRDWMILMGILNQVVNVHFAERGISWLDDTAASKEMNRLSKEVLRKPKSNDHFIGPQFGRALDGFHMTVLATWGFHPRVRRLKPAVVIQFLRDRMNHFKHDLPHAPMFGEPVGDWPIIDEESAG